MRVLLLGPYPPPHGGVQTHLVALRTFLRSRGIACPVINLTRFRRPDEDDVYYPSSEGEFTRLLLRIHCDVVHLHFGGHLSLRLLGLTAYASVLPHRKTVLTFHSGGYPRSPAGRTARPATLRGFVLRRLNRIIGVNEELVELFQRFGVPPECVRLIPPYGPLDEQPAAELPEYLRQFFRSHAPVLITVSGMEPEYDLATQVAALGLLRERHSRAGLVVIGSGSLEDQFRGDVAGTAWRDHILVCGDLPHKVTLRAVADSDLFLRTTLYDGDSISVREALHLGTPVIATDAAERPPLVTLIPPGNPRGLAAAIDQRLASGDQRPAPPDWGDSPLLAVLSLYEELLSPSPRRAG